MNVYVAKNLLKKFNSLSEKLRGEIIEKCDLLNRDKLTVLVLPETDDLYYFQVGIFLIILGKSKLDWIVVDITDDKIIKDKVKEGEELSFEEWEKHRK